MTEAIGQVFDALQGFYDANSSVLGALSMLLLALSFIGGLMIVGGGKWRWGVALVPLAAAALCLFALGLGFGQGFVSTVALVALLLEAVLFIGPFRVSAWAWPDRARPPKTPRKVFVALAVLAPAAAVGTVVAGYLCGYVAIVSPPGSGGLYQVGSIGDLDGGELSSLVLSQLYLVAGLSVLLYFSFWGLYTVGLSCFSLRRQMCRGRLLDCVMWRVEKTDCPLIRFEGDPNSYRVSRSLYKRLQGHVGEAYTYTLVTTFNGRQFIRRPPKRASV